MKVNVIKRYNDLALKKIQEIGTVLEVTDKRGEYLIGQGMVEKIMDGTEGMRADEEKETKATRKTGKDQVIRTSPYGTQGEAFYFYAPERG